MPRGERAARRGRRMIFEQSAKGGITMKQARYFVKPEEKPVIEDFKARVNVYGTEEEGGGSSLPRWP